MAFEKTVEKKNKKNTSQYSSYWFDDEDYTAQSYYGVYDDDDTLSAEDKQAEEEAFHRAERMVELIKLGAFMRSCGNFVNILTGRTDIKVRYASGDESYTDGKTVTLSSKVENNFDSTVGLALHEASHVKLTDFGFLKNMIEDAKFRREYITDEMIQKVIKLNPKIEKWRWQSMFGVESYPTFNPNASAMHQSADMFLFMQFKDVLNWVEDRRIDNWVYTTARGYRGYYEAMYDRYFFSDEVTKDLKKNDTFNTETLDSYMYRIINLLNPENDLTVLKGLTKIKGIIDTDNIDRLTSTDGVAKISKKVLSVIMDNITELNFVNQKMKQNGVGNGDGGEDGMTIDFDSLTDEECKKMFGMSKKALEKLIKKAQEQKDFVRGAIQKKKLSRSDSKQMNSLADSGVTIEMAGGEEFNGNTVKVLLLEKVTDSIIGSGEFGGVFDSPEYPDRAQENAVAKGFVLGKLLGRKLQVRNEERTLKFTRQDTGKIDKRLVASLGYDVENVFSKIEVNKFNKAHIHVSIDASGSMNGNRIANAVKTATAIAVASRMTANIECVISFRTTHNEFPIVYVGYDSRKNGLAHIRKFFPLFNARGTTPESLCFQVMMKKIFPKMQGNENFYFVNLSDGEPCFSANGRNSSASFFYGGSSAYHHCRRMVDTIIRENGATVISYLINDGFGVDLSSFKEMYGAKNAFAINTDSVVEIARTMNKKFLENSQRAQENIV